MNKSLYLVILLFLSIQAIAQQDTVAYAAQRVKVNNLLGERSAKFSQYDESLNQKTGIFGWQTRKDIKNSNEILREIVLTDNNIFKELKVLMDYKDLQNQQKVAQSDNAEQKIQNYQLTIKKLQDQNAELKSASHKGEKSKNLFSYVIVFLVLVLAGALYFFNKRLKRHEKITV